MFFCGIFFVAEIERDAERVFLLCKNTGGENRSPEKLGFCKAKSHPNSKRRFFGFFEIFLLSCVYEDFF